MSAPTAVDAFCGAGGLSLGLKCAGFEVLLGFDRDLLCVRTIEANPEHLGHPVLQLPIEEMLGGTLLRRIGLLRGELDLLAGGPPCQGFSVQRTIGSDSDDRNLLVDDYGDLVLEVLPRFFLLENVPGIGGKRGRHLIGRFQERMKVGGYFCHQTVLNAVDYGVPQRRRRYLIVGERLDGGNPAFTWPEPMRGKPKTVRDVIAHLPPPPNDGTEHPQFPGHRKDRLSETNKARLRSLEPGQARTHLPDHLLADCHKRSADEVGHRNVYGRMRWDEVAPTITARFDSFTRGQFGHPEQVRTISLHEGALLQTFPSTYRFVGSKVEVARQIGNAVPPKLGAAIGLAIARALTQARVAR